MADFLVVPSMDRIDALSYVAARIVFWLSLGGFAGFVYSYGWLVR